MLITKFPFRLGAKPFSKIFKRCVKNAISEKAMRSFLTQVSNFAFEEDAVIWRAISC